MSPKTLLAYYRQHQFNPVPIAIEEPGGWEDHLAKRRNLYDRHLGIPLHLLTGRKVLEFGCNSGENPLVLAHYGAWLTLVEPNQNVHGRLRRLFQEFGLEKQIVALRTDSVERFQSPERFDLVIAEGFINQLVERDQAVVNLLDHVTPGGHAVVSFDCLYGHFLEMVRKFLFWRVCRLSGIKDVYSSPALEVARQLFQADFERIATSRPFDAWWRDVLVNPCVLYRDFWTYHGLVEVIEKAGGQVLATSPRWATTDHYTWYKQVPSRREWNARFLTEWAAVLPYILTGLPPERGLEPAPKEVLEAVASAVARISAYATTEDPVLDSDLYPEALEEYLSRSNDPRVQQFGREISGLLRRGIEESAERLITAHLESSMIRGCWGAPYHYLAVQKPASD